MFTPQKIIVLAITLVAVWLVWRVIERRNAAKVGKDQASPKMGQKAGHDEPVDLVQCSQCGNWTEGPCNRPGCLNKG